CGRASNKRSQSGKRSSRRPALKGNDEARQCKGSQAHRSLVHRGDNVRMEAAGAFGQAFPTGPSHGFLVRESDPKFAKLKDDHSALWLEIETQLKRTLALCGFRPRINHD